MAQLRGFRTARVIALAAAVWAVAAAAATAAPAPSTTLSVVRTGYHGGTVTDNLSQITCPDDCQGTYQRDCTVGTPSNCSEPGNAKQVTLTSTVPSGFALSWSRTCAEGGQTANPCTVSGSGTITAHYDDVSPPSVALTAPAAGPVRGAATLAATAADDQSTVTGVQFLVNGVSVATDATAPYATSFDTTSLPDGPATVIARASNGDGDTADSSVAITIDNTEPGLTVGGPDGQTFGPGSTQSWTYSASDAYGAPTVRCSVTRAAAAPAYAPCSPGGGAHSVSGLAGGSYKLRVRATDGAGNFIERVSSFAIDATPPGTSINGGPADGAASAATSVTFTFSADEAGSTFRCRVHPAALTPGAFGPCSGAGTHTASGFAPGTYAFDVVAVDRFGNTDATPATRTFTVTGSGTNGTGNNTGVQPNPAHVLTFFTRFGRRTRVDKLTVSGAPAGARVVITCKSKRKGCALKRATVRFKGGSLKLAKRFKHRKLRAGAVITVVVSKPGFASKRFRYTVRPTRFPSVRIA
jgi:Bacterial Ig domain